MGKEFEHFSKDDIQIDNKQIKKKNTHNEISLYTCQDDYYQKTKNKQQQQNQAKRK